MNRIGFIAAVAACLAVLVACSAGWFKVAVEDLPFVDHIEAGMIEQDVFIETVAGSGQVFRVGKEEAARYADAPVYRSRVAVRHAPFSPARNGPYPRGASLGLSLGDWRAARGRVSVTCSGDEGRVAARFRDLIANGTYTMWYFRAAKAHMGCAECPFATIDLPVGAPDGSQSSFVADARGNAIFEAAFKPCLQPSDDGLAAALAVAYHSDGDTHGPSPGDMGRTSHVQLFAVLPGSDDD